MKSEESKKRPYHPPKIETYGDFNELTRGTTKGGTAQDGGGKPQTRVTGTPT